MQAWRDDEVRGGCLLAGPPRGGVAVFRTKMLGLLVSAAMNCARRRLYMQCLYGETRNGFGLSQAIPVAVAAL